MKQTWTYKADLRDARNGYRNLEEEQEKNLIAQIGLTLWGYLCQMEEENVRTQQ